MGRPMLSVTVNGESIEAPAGDLLLDVLRHQGIRVPTLCHDPRLTPYGGCRLCVVERQDGRGGLVTACSTPVQRGMKIETDTPRVIASRRRQLQLLVLNHRMDCPVCPRRGDCRFQDLIFEYGVPDESLPFELIRSPRKADAPIIVRDPEKCIICGKCVRICDEVQGVAAIGLQGRGLEAKVTTFLDRPLDCEFCGQCVNACPVGALVARPYPTEVPAWLRESRTTTCSFCSCGCQVRLETWQGRPQAAIPEIETAPNHGKLCVKGWLGWDLLGNPDRLDTPLLRKGDRLEPVSWEEALAAVVAAAARVRAEGRAICGIGSSRLTTEDAYLMQRFLRGEWGTPHVDLGPVGGAEGLAEGMLPLTGVAASSADYAMLAEADLVLVVRGDPTRTHPLVKTELVQRVAQRGRPIALAHGLSCGLETHAEIYLRLHPGSEEWLLSGLAAERHRRTGASPSTTGAGESSGDGVQDWLESIERLTPGEVARVTGAEPAGYEKLAARIASARSLVVVVVTGTGIPGPEGATPRSAARLAALVGSPDEGSGVLILGEKANVQGALDVGLRGDLLPGNRCPASPEEREEVAGVWGRPVPEGPGWSLREICRRAAGGDVGLLYLAGQDPVVAWDAEYGVYDAISAAGFVVVHEAFLTRTARMADVVLPTRILGERQGSVVSLDGVRRPLVQVFSPRGPLPQDGDIFSRLARMEGGDLPGGEALEREMESLVRWPRRKNIARAFEAVGTPAEAPARGEVLLDPSPQLFHSGTLTSRSPNLSTLSPRLAVRMHPEDASRAGLTTGEMVRVSCGERELILRARLDRTVRPGTIVVPWFSAGDRAGALCAAGGRLLSVTLRRAG